MKSRRNCAISGSIFFTVNEHDVMSLLKSGKSGFTKYVILLNASWLHVAVT